MDPQLTSLGRLSARATMQAFAHEAELAKGQSAWRKSLNGTWRFQLVDRPDQAPNDWITAQTDMAPWRNIDVPGVWTRQETGDLPHYANWQMPFEGFDPPHVPDDNPTGLYRCTVSLDASWVDRQTI